MTGYRIDVHSHFLGGPVTRLFDSRNYFGKAAPKIPEWTVDKAMEFMADHDIATQVLSLPLTFDERFDEPASASSFVREVNECYAELIRDHPSRFGAFAVVPTSSTDAALAEIDYAIDCLGLDGVCLNSNSAGRYFGDPFYEPIFAEVARRDVPVFVHPHDCPHIEALAQGRTAAIVEFPFDTARTINNAIYTGVFLRHPGLKVIVAHCGGVLPMLGWRIRALSALRSDHDEALSEQQFADALGSLYYDIALAGSRNSLLPTLEVTTPDHLLFGTDYPAAPPWVIDENTSNLTSFDGFTPAQLAAIEHGNAAALFPRLATTTVSE